MEDIEEINNENNANIILKERIITGIQVISSLKSSTDTYLSDWKGIIGEEIHMQQYLETQIKHLSEQIVDLELQKNKYVEDTASINDLEEIEKKIDNLEATLTEKLNALPFNVKAPDIRLHKMNYSMKCIVCGNDISCNIRTTQGSKKYIDCKKCGKYYLVKYTNENTISSEYAEVNKFIVKCPLCKKEYNVELPSQAGSMKTIKCEGCDLKFAITKTKDSYNIIDKTKEITDKFLRIVISKLPQKPWEKGMHKIIAQELGISNNTISKAIKQLTDEGKI